MIHTDTPSLSVCAFGAGAVHAAILALVLPVMITLPAPEDRAQGTVAIQVAVRSLPPSTFIAASMSGPGAIPEAQGDADEAAWTMPVDVEVTGALQDLPEQSVVGGGEAPLIREAALAEPRTSALSGAAATLVDVPAAALYARDAPASALEETLELGTVASIEVTTSDEPDFMPDVVPRPRRKPKLIVVEEPEAPKAKPAATTRRHVAAPSRAHTATKPFKGLLGGTQAVPMAEFPFRAGR